MTSTTQAATTGENPLLELGFHIPFDRIRAEHIEPAIDALIARAERAVEDIAAGDGPRTYANTLGALESATQALEQAMGVAHHLESVVTTPALRDANNAVQPKVSAFSSSIPTNPGLWKALKEFAATEEAASLDPTRARYLDKTIKDFRREGADLSPADKEKLQAIDVELAQVTMKFGQNALDATDAWELVVTDESRLAGLPDSAREAARASAASKDLEGWRFTLQAPSLIPVLTYLDDESIRRKMWHTYSTQATEGEFDNRPVIARILELRKERATLLGFDDFSDLVLEDRMAKTGRTAREFLADIERRLREPFAREHRELEAFRKSVDGGEKLEPWDMGYWAEKQRTALYEFDDEELRPYFSVDAVMRGVFELVSRLYGLKVTETEMPTWHESVRTFRIEDAGGRHAASFYVDLYARESKRSGAWMNALFTTVPEADGSQEPHLGLICGNVQAPVGDKPALLTHRDVEMVFHEFGHLIHHCVSRVSVRSLAGANVAWDFVELPSQIMENWCWEREALDLFAVHWKTGEPIPGALFDRMLKARNYRVATGMMRQIGFGTLDLMFHREYEPGRDGDLMAYARRIAQMFTPVELPDDYAMITTFGHLFSSPVGYAAAYYSYLWAEVLDADAFSRFKESGVFDPAVGRAFLELISKGDSEDPMDLFVAFRGREPELDALLERAGVGG